MDQLTDAAGAVIAAAVTLLVPPLMLLAKRAIEMLGQRILADVQARLGAGAARIAGEIVAEMRASPATTAQIVSAATIDARAAQLGARFADTVERHQVPPDVLAGMVAGELGKLGVAVARR